MSKEQFELQQPILEAILEKNVIYPSIPVDVALQEAEDLLVWCLPDIDALIKAGLDKKLVDDLSSRIGALRYVQSQWQKEYRSLEDAQKEWALKSPIAYELRDDLIHHFLHAYYKIPDLYARTQKIAEGSGHADMIQDMSDLSALGKANPQPLVAISLDLSLLDKSETTAQEMAVLLANSNGKRMEDSKTRILRDKAFSHMKIAVDEIRRCGQYIFWRDDQKRKGYVSKYGKSKRTKQAKVDQNIEETK